MRRDVDDAIARLAGARSGAFSRREVYAAGGDRRLLARRVRSQRWLHRGCGAFTLAPFASTLDQRRWVALLSAGADAHLSHESAAELHQLHGVARGLVVVTAQHPLHLELPGATIHQLMDVAPHHRAEIAGFLATTPARTIVDLAAVIGRTRLRLAIEDAVARRLTSFGQIERTLREVRRRGKPGVHKLAGVLDQLDGEPPPESELERLLHQVVHLTGLRLVRQHPLPTHQPIRGVVDAAIVESKLILEADGRTWHGREQSMANDRRRDREAARLGWLTLRFTYHELANDQPGCADDLLTTHLERTGV